MIGISVLKELNNIQEIFISGDKVFQCYSDFWRDHLELVCYSPSFKIFGVIFRGAVCGNHNSY